MVPVLGGDRGAVTVEAALALCSLVAVMVMVVAAVAAAGANLRCLDAAREAARLVARGEPQRAREIAADVAPRGATLDVRVVGDQVNVRVTAAAVPGIPGLSIGGSAVSVMEPAAFLGVAAAPGSELDPPADLPADPPADPPADGSADPPAGSPAHTPDDAWDPP